MCLENKIAYCPKCGMLEADELDYYGENSVNDIPTECTHCGDMIQPYNWKKGVITHRDGGPFESYEKGYVCALLEIETGEICNINEAIAGYKLDPADSAFQFGHLAALNDSAAQGVTP